MVKTGKKVLVCITPQSNSRRLIDKGNDVAKVISGELHILHIQKGSNIFMDERAAHILQDLFDYAKELSGIVHGLCGEDVTETILKFVKKKKITNVVLGQPAEDAPVKSEDVGTKLRNLLPYLEITFL